MMSLEVTRTLFMIIPSEADFQSPLSQKIERYLATDPTAARKRVRLFRLA